MSSKSHRSYSSFGAVCQNSERYFLVLSFEKDYGAKHEMSLNLFLQEVTASVSQVEDNCEQLSIPLRKHHIALVNPTSCLKHKGQAVDADWLPLDHLHKGLIPDDRRSPDKGDASLEAQDILDNREAVEINTNDLELAIAELIHALADKLPLTGHYLDIIWLATTSTDVPIANHVPLYGALQRLCSWHGGLLTVVLEGTSLDGPHNNTLNAWVNHFHGRVVSSAESVVEVVVQGMAWRGEIVLADGKGQKSLCVPGFVLSPHLNDNSKVRVTKVDGASDCISPGVRSSKSHANRKIVTFSRQLEVVCSVRRAEVPSVFLSPAALSLHLLLGSRLPRSEHFLRWLSEVGQSNDAAVIMRLPRRTLAPSTRSTRGARPINTKAWKECIKNNSGDLTVPDLQLRETQEFFYLLVHRSRGPSRDVIAQLMYSPHELSGAVHAQLAEYQQSLAFDEQQNARTTLTTIASLDGGQVQTLLETIKLAQAEAIKAFLEERRLEGMEPAISLTELQLLMGAVYSSVMGEMDEMSQSTEADHDLCTDDDLKNENIVSELDFSPSCWMERLALQNHEALERKIKRFKSGEMMLAGMPVPAPADNTITLTAEEFLKHFQASGLPSTEDLSPVSTTMPDRPGAMNGCPVLPWSELKKATFQEAQKYTFPGVLYCLDSGRSQQIDSHFSKMQQRYIRYETASTCSSEQAVSPAILTIPQPPSATDPTAATKTGVDQYHRDRQSSRGQKSAEKGQRSVMKGQGLAEKGRGLPKGLRSAEKRRRIMLERGHKISPGRTLGRGTKRKGEDEVPTSITQAKKRLVPRRTSPRKRVAGKEKPDEKPLSEKTTEDQQKASSSSTSSKPRKLSNSERTRMKLRQTVKEAVISRGITKENTCYKACIERLYRMAELYVKDLTSSRGLHEEMRNIAEANADFVVQFERNRIKNS